MANKLLVLGRSGTGKSYAIRNLDPTTTFIISPDKKALPLKGWRNNYKTTYKTDGKVDLANTNFYRTNDPRTILQLITAISNTRLDITTIVIDTLTLMLVDQFMKTAKDVGYEKFTDMALDAYRILNIIDDLREDLTVIVIGHIEDNYDSDGVLKSSFRVPAGKILKEKLTPEELFTTVLYTEVVMVDGAPQYSFLTQNNGKNTCKSPHGMFSESKISNDYKYVIEKIQAYESVEDTHSTNE